MSPQFHLCVKVFLLTVLLVSFVEQFKKTEQKQKPHNYQQLQVGGSLCNCYIWGHLNFLYLVYLLITQWQRTASGFEGKNQRTEWDNEAPRRTPDQQAEIRGHLFHNIAASWFPKAYSFAQKVQADIWAAAKPSLASGPPRWSCRCWEGLPTAS